MKISEADLEVGRIDLKGGIARIAVKVVGKKAEVKLAFPRGLRIVDREETCPAVHGRSLVAWILGRASGLRLN